MYESMFDNVESLYLKLGYDMNTFNNMRLKEDMILSLIKLSSVLNRTPNSRDINNYSNKSNEFYRTTTYINKFGSIYNAQLEAGLNPTIIGRNIGKSDVIDFIMFIYSEENCVPTKLLYEKYIGEYSFCCINRVITLFDSWTNALKACGFTENDIKSKIYYSDNGTKCMSIYERTIINILENNNIEFKTEERYSDYIKSFNKKYRFDISINNKHIEMFGIVGNELYNERKLEKIQLCKDNNINLVYFEGNEIMGMTEEQILNKIFQE